MNDWQGTTATPAFRTEIVAYRIKFLQRAALLVCKKTKQGEETSPRHTSNVMVVQYLLTILSLPLLTSLSCFTVFLSSYSTVFLRLAPFAQIP